MPGQPLDAILRKDLLGSRDDQGNTNFVTINSDSSSMTFDSSGSEQGVVLSVDYVNGVALDLNIRFEASIDGVTFSPLADSRGTKNITDANGNITFDVVNLNANFVRIGFDFNSGTVDVYVQASAKRRH